MSNDERMIIKAWNSIIERSQNVRATGNALHVVNEDKAAVHEGYAYHYGAKISMAPGGVQFFAATPNSYDLHWVGLSVDAITGPIEINFYKGSVVGSGTQAYPHNRQLNVTSSCSSRIEGVNVLTTTGTLVSPQVNLATDALGGRDAPNGNTALFAGFVLYAGDTYTVGFMNTSVDSSYVWVNFSFTEPPNA
jgi:hypothetical protein